MDVFETLSQWVFDCIINSRSCVRRHWRHEGAVLPQTAGPVGELLWKRHVSLCRVCVVNMWSKCWQMQPCFHWLMTDATEPHSAVAAGIIANKQVTIVCLSELLSCSVYLSIYFYFILNAAPLANVARCSPNISGWLEKGCKWRDEGLLGISENGKVELAGWTDCRNRRMDGEVKSLTAAAGQWSTGPLSFRRDADHHSSGTGRWLEQTCRLLKLFPMMHYWLHRCDS